MRVIINHHRNNGNTESYTTEEYQASNSDDVDDVDFNDDDNPDDNYESNAIYEDVVLSVFGDEEVEDLVRPTITRSGRSITRRSEIDCPYF